MGCEAGAEEGWLGGVFLPAPEPPELHALTEMANAAMMVESRTCFITSG